MPAIHYILESAFCLACFYAFYWFALRRETFFQLNRWYLLLSPLLAFAIPALKIQLEKPTKAKSPVPAAIDWQAVVEQTQQVPMQLRQQLETPLPAAGWSLTLGEALTVIYLTGAALLATLLLVRLWRLMRFIRRCRKAHAGKFTLAEAADGEMPVASFFSFVFWNKREVSEDERLIIEHELVHARQWHSLDVLLMEALVVWQWFNPLVYVYRRSLQAVHEYIADDYVVRHSRQRYAYAALLAQQYRGRARPDLMNTFHAQIQNRLTMLAKHPSRRLRRAKFALALPLALALMLLFSFRMIDTISLAEPIRHAAQRLEVFSGKLAEVEILSTPTLEKQPVTEPTPYIFYWGVIQCKFTRSESSGRYLAEIHAAPIELREAFKREPRLFNGVRLEQKMAFNLNGIAVRSNYYDESVYAACRKSLEDFAADIKDGDVLALDRIVFPDLKTGSITIFLDKNAPDWLPVNTTQVNMRPDPSVSWFVEPTYLQWDERQAPLANRQFVSLEEFWSIIRIPPHLLKPDGQSFYPERFGFWIKEPERGKEISHYGVSAARAFTFEQLQEQLELHRNEIKVGGIVRLDSWDADEDKALIWGTKLAVFDIVADDDPRKSLKLSDQNHYSLEWGNYSGSFPELYAREFVVRDNTIDTVYSLIADRPFSQEVRSFTKPEILQMLTLPARLYREKNVLLKNLSFQLQYRDKMALVHDGICPPDMIAYLEKNLKPYDRISLSDIRAEDAVLSTIVLYLEVKPIHPKQPLQTGAEAAAPKLSLVRLDPPAPNPANDRVRVEYEMPAAAKTTLRVVDAQGRTVWEKTQNSIAGANSLELSSHEWKSKGWFAIVLETPFGAAQEKILVQQD